jgi:PAS domain S-box-containing protein
MRAAPRGRRFRDLVEQVEGIIWEADPTTWQYTFVNQRAEEILGYPVERWLAEPEFWVKLVHPDDRAQAVAHCRAAIRAGQDHELEHRAVAADGHVVWLRDRVYVVRDSEGRARKLRGVMVDITARKQAEAALQTRARQQAAVAELGQRALAGIDLTTLLNEAVSLVARTLEVEYSNVLELLPDGHALLLRAGVGWRPGLVGRATVGAGRESQAGYTLLCREPVIVEDLRAEARFSGPPLLHEHGVVSGLSVVIPGQARPFGVLGAHTAQQRSFTRDDVNVLQAVANVLAMTIERQRIEAERAELLTREQAARAEAEAARQRLEAVLQQMPAGVLIAEAPSGRLLLGNEQVAHVWRHAFVPCAEVNEYLEYKGFHPDGRPYEPTEWPLARAIATGEVVGGEEIEFLRGDGTRGTMDMSAAPIYDRKGRIVAGVATFYDVTERKEAAEVLRRSEERFRVAQELSRDAFTILRSVRDERGAIVDFEWEYVNPAAAGILRHRVEELVGRRLLEVLPGNRAIGPFDAYVRVVETGQSHDIELSCRAEGIDGWFRNMTVKLNDGVAVSFSDITARKRTEDALRFLAEASTRLAASLDYEATLATLAQLAVPKLADWCVIDLLEADQSVRRLTAVAGDSANEGVALELVRYPPDAGRADHPVERALRTGQSQLVAEVSDALLTAVARAPAHLAILRQLRPRSLMSVPLVARGRILGAVSVVRAESGRRYGPADLALAEELARRAALSIDNARLHREAQEAIRMREAFLARASHELRTPLTIVKGHLALLGKRLTGGEPEATAAVSVAQRHVDRMTRLVADLLDASRLAAGRLTLKPEPLDLKGVVAEALAQVRSLAQAKGVGLVEAVVLGLALVGDRLKLEQVVINLLTNAIKHTPAEGTIRVEGRRGGEEVELSVRDSGEGLASEHLEQIFEPFFQVGSATGHRKAPGQGAGLGLAICRQIVMLHGGRIWAESEGPDRGSAFVVRLPAAASVKGSAA